VANKFSYLTVLISIILGLGLAHLLGGLARSVSRRKTTSFYWPTLVWIAVLLILIIQVWWVDFSLSQQARWTLAGFASTLLIPAALYFMSFLILPETNDMREAFFENRLWFFSLLAVVPLFGSLQQLLVEGHVHQDFDTLTKGAGLILSVGAIYFGSERAQKILAVIGIGFVVAYVCVFFFQLPPPA
jgi:hypothetical protein